MTLRKDKKEGAYLLVGSDEETLLDVREAVVGREDHLALVLLGQVCALSLHAEGGECLVAIRG